MPVSDPITDCTFDRLVILNRESLNRPQIAGEVLSYGFEGPQNFLRPFSNFLDSEIEYHTTLPLTINSYRIISLRIANTHKITAVQCRYQRSWDLAKQAGIWIREAGI